MAAAAGASGRGILHSGDGDIEKDINLIVLTGHNAGGANLVECLLLEGNKAFQSEGSSLQLDILRTEIGHEFKSGRPLDFRIPDKHAVFHIVDTPGHVYFMRRVICGETRADGALVVVDGSAADEEAWTAQKDALSPQIRLLARLGVHQIAVAVTNLPAADAAAHLARAVAHVTAWMRESHLPDDQVRFVPVGMATEPSDNVRVASTAMRTLRREGSLFEALSAWRSQVAVDVRARKPLRCTVAEVYKIGGAGTEADARVQYGTLTNNHGIVVAPSGHVIDALQAIQMHHCMIADALPGDRPALIHRSFSKDETKPGFIRRGYVVGEPKRDPPRAVSRLRALIWVGTSCRQLQVGASFDLQAHNANTTGTVASIVERLCGRTGRPRERDGGPVVESSRLLPGEIAVVELTLAPAIVLDRFADFPRLGRFVARTPALPAAGEPVEQRVYLVGVVISRD